MYEKVEKEIAIRKENSHKETQLGFQKMVGCFINIIMADRMTSKLTDYTLFQKFYAFFY